MKKLCIATLFLLFLLSCKTTSKIQHPAVTKSEVPSLKKEKIRFLAAKIKNNQLNFKWLSAHISVQMDIDSSHHSFKVYLRMCKDSAIWMSVSKIGLKVAEILLTEDSAIQVDDMHNTYFKGNYEQIDNLLDEDLDFDMMQSVLIGSSMEFYNDTSKMKSYFDGKQYIISTVRKRKLKRVLYRNMAFRSKNDAQFIFLDTNDFRITHVRVEDFVNHRTFDAYYDDFRKVDSLIFPFHIQYVIAAGKTIKIDLRYKKILFKSHDVIPFIIPKKYEQVQY